MKAKYLTITAAAAALLLSACQRDELGGGSLSGEEVTVGISAMMPLDGGAVVKSDAEPGKGDEVNRCIMQVYLADDTDLSNATKVGEPKTVEVTDGKASFGSLQLVAGHTYRLVLWADCATKTSGTDGATASFSDLYYNTGNYPEVSFKDGVEYAGNDDSRDAFFASYKLEVYGPSNHTVKLHRPFGQLNIIATDYEIVKDNFSTFLPTAVNIEFANIPSGINLFTGDLTEAVQQTLTSGPVPIANVTPAATDGSRQLSFDYIFAPQGDDQQLVLKDFKMFFLDNDGTEKVSHYTFQNIPVKRNYQTNVSGALLTDRTGIDIEVVPNFDGQHNEDVPDAKVVALDEDTRLSSVMTEEELLQYTSLKINGIMKEEDFEFISPAVHVFSWPDEPAPGEYHLETLDLSDAEITVMYPIGDEGRSSRNPNNVLTTVVLPEGLESIRGNAFSHCWALSSINLPSTLKTMSVGVFYYAYALTEIELPDGLESIGDACFLNSGITSITTGAALTKLGGPSAGGVFSSCDDLVTVDLSSSTGLTEIMERTFYNCSALETVLLPSTIEEIGSNAFYGCSSLKSLTLPASVTSIYDNAFDRVSSITLTVEATKPPTIEDGNLPARVFDKILVPSEAVDTYKKAEGWADVADKIAPIQ
mgnify:CR=1 FL=1